VHAYPIFDSNGEVSQIIEYCLDINARKKAEEEKSKLEAELRQAQKMEAIGTLAGGIAHDFNNILSVIIGYADLLKFNIQSGKGVQEEEIDQVLTAGKRAKELVQQILAFSRKSEHYLQPLYPHLIVKEALKMMRSTLPATITIEQDIDTECGKIQAVSTEIHQIMVNLCTNAMQAMGPGKGVLRVSLCRKDIPADQIKESDASPGPFIVLSISDTGNGMDRETIQRIFEPYYTTKEVGKGTGLGLSTVYGIVKDLKGFIEVESEPEKGTTFQVYMPALPIGLSDSEETEQNAPLPTGAERILLVDDENSIVLMQKATLENLGYQVTATTNSLEALRNFQETPDDFDLLITDMTMPDMTGAELAQRVLSIKSGFPIILCTGFSEQIDEEKAKAIGIKEYIKKPIIIMEIATAVRKVLKAGDI
jgi:nitrogen-specific signal transduction histidine kinase/ActR/RegA family two-component response regulator